MTEYPHGLDLSQLYITHSDLVRGKDVKENEEGSSSKSENADNDRKVNSPLNLDPTPEEAEHSIQQTILFVKPDGMLRRNPDLLREVLLPRLEMEILFESGTHPLTEEAVDELYSDMSDMPVFSEGHVATQMTSGPGHLFVVQGPNAIWRARNELVGDSAELTGLRGDVLNESVRNRTLFEDVAGLTGDKIGIKRYPYAYNGIHSPRTPHEVLADWSLLRRFTENPAILKRMPNQE